MNLLKQRSLVIGIALLVIPLLLHISVLAQKRGKEPPAIPVCSEKLGTLTVDEPRERWWTEQKLESPDFLIKFFVRESKCFTLLDRGKGFEAAQREKELSQQGQLRRGSNIGLGTTLGADYVLVPDLGSQNASSSQQNLGAGLGRIFGGGIGGILSGINIRKKTANVILSLTDVRSSEQAVVTEGSAEKTDIGFGVGVGGLFPTAVGAGISSYNNTEIGQVIAMAYLQAYIKMVEEIKRLRPNPKLDNVLQAVRMTKIGRMYEKPIQSSQIVRDLEVGMMLYPTGKKEGVWWEVEDELGNKGWVSSLLFMLAK